jgi:N6-adenosine-specific RNA methylase IME4
VNFGDAWPDKKYDVVYADPPWDYANRVQHGGTEVGYTSGAQAFYPTMTPDELCSLPVRSLLLPNSIVFMWTTGPQMEIAMRVLKAWGATFKTVAFVWDKVQVNPGAYTMSQCEYVLVGKRGSIPKPRGTRNERQYVLSQRTTHSTKPVEVRVRIERMFPTQARIELFARLGGPGWDLWGNQAREARPCRSPDLDPCE